MLTSEDKRIARRLKHRLQNVSTVKRMVIYGSRARGDASEESDLDVFIELTELTHQLRRQISDIAWEIGFNEGLVISTFVTTSQALVDSPLAANPLLKAIQNEGILV